MAKTAASKPRVRTGEPRQVNRQLNIDRLPESARAAILKLRNQFGKNWIDIEDISKLQQSGPDVRKGFIDWEKLPSDVRRLFPERKLPHSTLHRWYDIRVDQAQKEIRYRAEQAEVLAKQFRGLVEDGADNAVMNAIRTTLFRVLTEQADTESQTRISGYLISLAEVMQRQRANDIKERAITVIERKIKMLEEREAFAIRKIRQEAERLEKKRKSGTLTQADLSQMAHRAYGLPIKADE